MTGTPATGIQVVLDAVPTLVSLASGVWDMMVANPILVVYVAAGLLSIGFAVFRKAKKTAR